MTFVVDASMALAWCFDDEATPITEHVLDRLSAEDARVPELWSYEIANVLLGAERRGRLSEAQANRFVQLLLQLPITVEAAPVDIGVLLAVGRRHALTAYDAGYLWLAERDGLPLATLDRKLADAAREAGVPLLAEI